MNLNMIQLKNETKDLLLRLLKIVKRLSNKLIGKEKEH